MNSQGNSQAPVVVDIEKAVETIREEVNSAKKYYGLGLYAGGLSLLILMLWFLGFAPGDVSVPVIGVSLPSNLAFIGAIIGVSLFNLFALYHVVQAINTYHYTLRQLVLNLGARLASRELVLFKENVGFVVKPLSNIRFLLIFNGVINVLVALGLTLVISYSIVQYSGIVAKAIYLIFVGLWIIVLQLPYAPLASFNHKEYMRAVQFQKEDLES